MGKQCPAHLPRYYCHLHKLYFVMKKAQANAEKITTTTQKQIKNET